MIAEASVQIPVFLWVPLCALILLTLAEHRFVAPRLVARRRRKRLSFAHRAMRYEQVK